MAVRAATLWLQIRLKLASSSESNHLFAQEGFGEPTLALGCVFSFYKSVRTNPRPNRRGEQEAGAGSDSFIACLVYGLALDRATQAMKFQGHLLLLAFFVIFGLPQFPPLLTGAENKEREPLRASSIARKR